MRAMANDTSFLAYIKIIDYSILVGVDEEQKVGREGGREGGGGGREGGQAFTYTHIILIYLHRMRCRRP